LRDIVEPGRSLGHVDGKTSELVNAREESHRSNLPIQPEISKVPEREKDLDEEAQELRRIGNLQLEEQKFQEKSVSTDEDITANDLEMKSSTDKTLCEDCN
jgi:hypothetical protein